MNKECETCIKRKTVYCPISIECMATDDMPYYQNRIMLLEENQELKDNWNNLKEYLNEGTFYYKTGNGEYTTEMVSNRINGLDTLRKMQELEKRE